MKHALLIICALSSLYFVSCAKADISSYNEVYCEAIESENFDKAGDYLNKFLKANKQLNHEDMLDKTVEWLMAKECVTDASLICNSCIETAPPQSEIRISFTIGDSTVVKTIDLLMTIPIVYHGIHD
jgi:hypothetical protein